MVIRQLPFSYICNCRSQVHLLNFPWWTLSALPLFFPFPFLSECKANHQLVFLCSHTLPSWQRKSCWAKLSALRCFDAYFCCCVCRNDNTLHYMQTWLRRMRAALATCLLIQCPELSFYLTTVNLLRENTLSHCILTMHISRLQWVIELRTVFAQ